MTKRIMVDMSATLIHHGHVRLLQKAAELGSVVVALTTDEEIRKTKGYTPELNYGERKEILESIRYVDEVVPSAWLIDEAFLDRHECDLLIHGSDNSNRIPEEKLVVFPRTEGISSSDMRERVLDRLIALNSESGPGDDSETLARIRGHAAYALFRRECRNLRERRNLVHGRARPRHRSGRAFFTKP